MPKIASKALQTFLDVALLATVFVVAFAARFDWNVPAEILAHCLVLLPYVVVVKYLFLHWFEVPKFSWRYIGLREVTRILLALGAASALLLFIRFSAVPLRRYASWLDRTWVPTGIILIDFVLSFCAIAGVRALRRLHSERGKRTLARVSSPTADTVPTLLVGAGQVGVAVARDIYGHPGLRIRAVGFLDDDQHKVGSIVQGIPVLASTSELVDVVARTGAKQVLLTFASNPKQLRRLTALCEEARVKVKIIPGLHEIVGGRVNLSRMRDIAIEDLLRREPVALDETAIFGTLGEKVVMITGAGGSIGSELCRQVCRYSPARVLLVERAENALFEIDRELSRAHPGVQILPLVADVTDADRMRAVFAKYRPSIVLHAAAHKHVPMMEDNPGEAVKNNVFGTQCVAMLADEFSAERFVMISTDKAVNPTSVMGASKRLAEMYIQALSTRSSTKFVAVRFGNVLGSAGSVIPIFRDQIARGGPVTVTHPDMRRYFMTIPEASQLVLQAATMGAGGEIFILDMGEPVRIVDLASDLIRLSGLRVGEDVEIVFTGIRPGEKLFEELSVAGENATRTRHSKIFVGNLSPCGLLAMQECVSGLRRTLDEDSENVREALGRAVPESQLEGGPVAASEKPQPVQPLTARPQLVVATERC